MSVRCCPLALRASAHPSLPVNSQNRFCAEHLQFCAPILALCEQHGAQLQTFWTLSASASPFPSRSSRYRADAPLLCTDPNLLASPPLRTLASQQSLTPPQALYKFLLQSTRFGAGRIVPLNGTTSLEHMRQDLEVLRLVEVEKEAPERRGRELESAEKGVEELLWGPG